MNSEIYSLSKNSQILDFAVSSTLLTYNVVSLEKHDY